MPAACAQHSSEHKWGLHLVQPAAQTPSRHSCASLWHSKQHIGRCLPLQAWLRPGSVCAAWRPAGPGFGTLSDSGEVHSEQASICSAGCTLHGKDSLNWVSGLMRLTLLLKEKALREAPVLCRSSQLPNAEASAYAEGVQHHADALLHDLVCSASAPHLLRYVQP